MAEHRESGKQEGLKIQERGNYLWGKSLRRWERVGLRRKMTILTWNSKDTSFSDCEEMRSMIIQIRRKIGQQKPESSCYALP